jgi:pentatricopeptide repeat domain-containing protein 1
MPSGGTVVEFGMHAFTVGSATLSVIRWVTELRDRLPRDGTRVDPLQKVSLLLNKGKPSREHTYPAIRAALMAMLGAWSGPFVLQDVPQGCRIEAPAAEVVSWLQTGSAEWPLSVLSETAESPRGVPRDLFFHEDSVVEARCAEAYAAVRQFEAAYGKYVDASWDADGSPLGASRQQWFCTLCQTAQAFRFSEEVVHDAFLLADRAIGAALKSVAPKALAVACLFMAARQGGEEAMPALASADGVEGLQVGECEAAMALVLDALKNDAASISALRVLKLYLERLGADFVATRPREGLWAVAGMALRLLPDALCDAQLRLEPPSVVAAAVLLAGRRAAGISPFWPSALAALTGMDESEEGVLATAADRAFSLVGSSVSNAVL